MSGCAQVLYTAYTTYREDQTAHQAKVEMSDILKVRHYLLVDCSEWTIVINVVRMYRVSRRRPATHVECAMHTGPAA